MPQPLSELHCVRHSIVRMLLSRTIDKWEDYFITAVGKALHQYAGQSYAFDNNDSVKMECQHNSDRVLECFRKGALTMLSKILFESQVPDFSVNDLIQYYGRCLTENLDDWFVKALGKALNNHRRNSNIPSSFGDIDSDTADIEAIKKYLRECPRVEISNFISSSPYVKQAVQAKISEALQQYSRPQEEVVPAVTAGVSSASSCTNFFAQGGTHCATPEPTAPPFSECTLPQPPQYNPPLVLLSS